MKLVVTENITLDGVIDAAEGWFTPESDGDGDTSDIGAELRRQMEQESGLLLGRVTFEEFRGYWPLQTNDPTGISDHLNRTPKYVASTTLRDPGWENTTVLAEDVLGNVRSLKEGPGGDIVVTGSISLVHDLAAAGLVDEYRLFLYPVAIGRGRRLFVDGGDRRNLQLIQATPFRSGVVLLTYKPA
jgi:dihydrofolate reductase